MTDYITTANFKTRFGITTSGDDVRIGAHVTAASLQIDSMCSRQFGPGSSATRYFYPDSQRVVRIDDCHTITEVSIDSGDNGNYDTTFTAGSDYNENPYNGIGPNGQSGWPVFQLWANGRTYWFPTHTSRPSVKVTATFGWAAVPTDIAEATYLLAHRLYFERDVPSGNVPGSVEFGGAPLRKLWTVDQLLVPYKRADRKMGIAG